MEQLSMFAKEKNVQSCYGCDLFSELKVPRKRSDGAVIYGYCFKDGDTNYSGSLVKTEFLENIMNEHNNLIPANINHAV